jgi:flagellar assembly protein FliH
MTWSEPVRFAVAPRTFIVAVEEAAPAPALAMPDPAALEAAYARGWEESAAHAEAQLAEQRNEFAACQESVFQSLAAQHRTLVEKFTAALPLLASQIAAKVLAGFQPDAETMKRLVTETLAEIEPGTPEVELALAPGDCALVEGVATEFGQSYPGLRLRADGTLRAGDCRVQSKFGLIDGRLRSKLENAIRSLS